MKRIAKGSWVMVLLTFLLLTCGLFASAPYDTLTIKQLQYVPDPVSNDLSPFLGDTVVVRGLVMHGPRELWVGARWAVHIVDPDSFPNPWSGFFIIQHDTFAVNTNLGFLEPGMICYFTGVVDEFNNFSQMFLLTDPNFLVPVDIESAGNPLPDPVVLTAADIETRASAEQWESMWTRLENVTVVNNNVPGNWASVTDASGGTAFMGEYFLWFNSRLNAGTYTWPPPGTRLNVNGFVRDEPSGYTTNPRTDADIEILTNPPVISDVMRNPGVPTSADNVTVSATIVDNGTVSQATLKYSVDWGPFQDMVMSANADTFSADIPAQSDGAFVRYFITAVDNEGDFTQLPGDTSNSIYFYVVRDAGLSIKDVQYTYGYPSDDSGYEGYQVTLQGVVTTDSSDFVGEYYIEEKDSAWYGMWVRDPANTFLKGDLIEVTGTVEERFGVTRITDVTSAQVLTPGVGVFNPVPVTTGEVGTGGANAEAYESVLIQVENVTVTNPFPDAPSNFGEFEVDDGSGPVRVDDASDAFRGNQDSLFALNDQIGKIIALGYYSFGNYKLIPRDSSDIIDHVTSIGDKPSTVPVAFRLAQNFPNPFNPVTEIRFSVPKSGKYTLEIFNVLGQKIVTLSSAFHPAGNYSVKWNGTDTFGNRVGSGIYFYNLRGNGVNLTKKMILLK